MKYLILFLCLITAFLKSSAQNTASPLDTVVCGSAETNFPGGQEAYNKYVSKNATYPDVAIQNNVQGCTYIKFSIGKDSSISNVKTYSGVGSGMDEEAIKLIKQSGKWSPSKVNGSYVETSCIVPVRFILTWDEKNKLKGSVDGNPSQPNYLASIIDFESFGISLSDVANYEGKSVKFIGRVYGTKTVSDTTFVLTCGEYNYPSKYVNVVLMGKNARLNDPKAKLSGYLIEGKGTVTNYSGTLIVIVDDKKQYKLLKGFDR